jgi:hypothetical protein
VITAIISWDHKYIPEIFTVTIYSITLYLFLRGILQKTNDRRIVIKTKKFNWIPMVIWVAMGIEKLIFKSHFHESLVFGFISESTSQGIGFILLGIASFQKNIIIDNDGIRISDWFTSLIKYSELTEIKLTHSNLSISNEDFSYHYKIFSVSDSLIELVNRKIEEKCTLPNKVYTP